MCDLIHPKMVRYYARLLHEIKFLLLTFQEPSKLDLHAEIIQSGRSQYDSTSVFKTTSESGLKQQLTQGCIPVKKIA